jgi:hypothetical protein
LRFVAAGLADATFFVVALGFAAAVFAFAVALPVAA